MRNEKITVELPAADSAFVKEYARQNGASVDKVIDDLIKTLQQVSSHPIDPSLKSMVGILPQTTDIDKLRMDYLTKKYLYE